MAETVECPDRTVETMSADALADLAAWVDELRAGTREQAIGGIHALLAQVRPGARFVHVRTGGAYTVVDVAKMESDSSPVVVYRTERYGTVWVRPLAEFCDGRFEPLFDGGLPEAVLESFPSAPAKKRTFHGVEIYAVQEKSFDARDAWQLCVQVGTGVIHRTAWDMRVILATIERGIIAVENANRQIEKDTAA